MREPDPVAAALTAAFLDGPWTVPALTDGARRAVGRPRARWAGQLAARVVERFPRPPADAPRELDAFVRDCAPYAAARAAAVRAGSPLRVAHLATATTRMGRNRFGVPELDTVADLAGFLGIGVGQLEWFADVHRFQVRAGGSALHHYRARWVGKRGAPRLLEVPRPRLVALQRRVLREVLDRFEVHDAVHGFTAGRSALTGAREHVGARTVVRFDLEGFFASVPASAVHGCFRSTGYPEPVAHLLTGLVTHVTPWRDLRTMPDGGSPEERFRLRRNLSRAHLPQGAPTSPALANLCARGLDRRLAGLARSVGATFTRYADDLTFSSPTGLHPDRLRRAVEAVVTDEGFTLNPAKTRVRGAGSRQVVTGLVVNERPNVPREEFDRLKAVLHNCVQHGPGTQDRDGHPDFRAHLLARVSRVEHVNPAKGRRLRRSFERIRW
ncbi:reverse transcriptase family protein [Kineococcus sp. SYSU DK002]|uniref:reverse transcriptase family protein n=1 Tax=Kineococcus sp. SYSU DK002 TaxID=3383123 RepID=UPI003D7CC0AC